MTKYGIDWSKVDPAVEPRLAALAPKVEVEATPEPEPEPVRKTRAKRVPKVPVQEPEEDVDF